MRITFSGRGDLRQENKRNREKPRARRPGSTIRDFFFMFITRIEEVKRIHTISGQIESTGNIAIRREIPGTRFRVFNGQLISCQKILSAKRNNRNSTIRNGTGAIPFFRHLIQGIIWQVRPDVVLDFFNFLQRFFAVG